LRQPVVFFAEAARRFETSQSNCEEEGFDQKVRPGDAYSCEQAKRLMQC